MLNTRGYKCVVEYQSCLAKVGSHLMPGGCQQGQVYYLIFLIQTFNLFDCPIQLLSPLLEMRSVDIAIRTGNIFSPLFVIK